MMCLAWTSEDLVTSRVVAVTCWKKLFFVKKFFFLFFPLSLPLPSTLSRSLALSHSLSLVFIAAMTFRTMNMGMIQHTLRCETNELN